MSEIMTYISDLYDCRKIQLLLLFQEKNIPIELLFYNAYESTQSIYDHLFIQDKNRWSYDSHSMNDEDIKLFNIQMEEQCIHNEEELDYLLQDLLNKNQYIYLWVNLDYMPHWVLGKHYLVEGALHSVFLKQLQINGDQISYLLQDNYPPFCDYVDQSFIKDGIFKGDPQYTHLVSVVSVANWNDQLVQASLEERFTIWRKGLVDHFQFYDHILQFIEEIPANPPSFYERLEHALTLVTGSRYVFARFLEYVGASEELVRCLDQCSQIAERMKNAFAKAVISGKINQSKLSPLCMELKRLEMECFQTLTSDSFAPILLSPLVTSFVSTPE
ncbi:hypothetical protein [Paenibacillus pini]|uniref:BtrH protein n=1 Tax=Paenibacillus pini JCM 16418 TaxID=1236976 RepID=W7YWY9_9BACL|nr:hypothetical protein [Paenibacillus pini]GAF09196.1 BtrH protein [Paenibacillus pini JCM 16418]